MFSSLLNPDSFEYAVIEINPRASAVLRRLRQRATGYPIAKIECKDCFGI